MAIHATTVTRMKRALRADTAVVGVVQKPGYILIQGTRRQLEISNRALVNLGFPTESVRLIVAATYDTATTARRAATGTTAR